MGERERLKERQKRWGERDKRKWGKRENGKEERRGRERDRQSVRQTGQGQRWVNKTEDRDGESERN